MNPAKCTDYDYIHFLIGTPPIYSCTEAARVQPEQPNPPTHDALTRLLRAAIPSKPRVTRVIVVGSGTDTAALNSAARS